jgi:hypothetical protein
MDSMSKTKGYTDVVSLDIIGLRLGNYLQEKKYAVSYVVDDEKSWIFIQTKRMGKIKLKNQKCMNIIIQGNREECTVTISDGVWGENTIDSSKPGKLIPYKGIFADRKKLVVPIILKKHIFDFLDKATLQ